MAAIWKGSLTFGLVIISGGAENGDPLRSYQLPPIQGKTMAGAYCVRAKPGATVSTPLKWSELKDDLDPSEFHLGNAVERFKKVGDIWNEAMKKKKNSLRALV